MRPDAAVFWCSRQCPHVLPVIAKKALSPETLSFDLARLPCRAALMITADGRQHVMLRNAHRDLQLVVEGAEVLRPVRLSVDAIWPADRMRQHLNALECLNAFHATGQFPDRLFPPEARASRLRFVLQALDGSLGGASHRQIAMALLARQRVQADWTDPRNHLRDRIRRAVRRGHMLMDRGYRDFLV
ncbi:DUF2285 domain-containing protein [Mesorhizobium japonicum R7A]|uniref:DUF2285 domain-containing protein n=1 Tax=Mesorhizobium loti R88b TaxID=935548 RepID=A0A6M7WNK7_RHILI|nr:DUF2285 domain-containing protein [Mesorhizobium japonicum R7A]QKD05710.1 DUF2285 domain-containing protein [Mesorhizobium loti R88b]